jgi:hypothetical protein
VSMRTSEGGNNAEAVSVWLLGGFRIFVGSRSIGEDVWRLGKARAKVKLLAPGHRLHRERVLDILWPDLGREAAANNLRQALHVARRVFDPNPGVGTRYLDSRGEMLALCRESALGGRGRLRGDRGGDPGAILRRQASRGDGR